MTTNSKQNLKTYSLVFVTAAVTFLGNFLFSSFRDREDKLNNGASVDYVDKIRGELQDQIEQKAAKDVVSAMKDDIREIKDNVNYLYRKEISKNHIK